MSGTYDPQSGDPLRAPDDDEFSRRIAGPDCGVDGCQREVGHIGDHRRFDPPVPRRRSGCAMTWAVWVLFIAVVVRVVGR